MRPPINTLWNLFLAIIPVILALGMERGWKRYPKLHRAWWLWFPLGLIWALFLPNTCYLITEWRHFIEYIISDPFDIRQAAHNGNSLLAFLAISTFYVFYSGTGVILFVASIWPIDQIVKTPTWGKAVFFMLCALGVYLGLVRRLNSWDFLSRPGIVVAEAVDGLTHPLRLILIVAFGVALWFGYWLFEVFIEGLIARLKRTRRSPGVY